MIFTATSRFSDVSRARYTSPIPPRPITERISYRPSRVPEGKAMVGADYTAAGFGPDSIRHHRVERRPILPRSLHRPSGSTDGRLTENLNKTGVRLWT